MTFESKHKMFIVKLLLGLNVKLLKKNRTHKKNKIIFRIILNEKRKKNDYA